MSTLPLRAAVKRGALVTLANWPVVLIDFTLESLYKLTLTIPILGGALMVAAIVGTDLGAVIGEGVRATADAVVSSLASAPIAFVAFLSALAVVGVGAEAVLFSLKIGTLRVLVDGERRAADIHEHPVDGDSLAMASAYSLAAVYDGTRTFGRRALALALGLGMADVVIGGVYLVVVGYGFSLSAGWTPAWPLIVVIATTTAVVTVAAVNLAYDLLRVIVVTDDCTIAVAFSRLARFATEDSRQVIGIFAVMGGVMLLATAGSILATAGLATMAWMPIVGLLAVPLQAAAWILRGLIFQYMSLAALSAYQTQYRRFAADRRAEGDRRG